MSMDQGLSSFLDLMFRRVCIQRQDADHLVLELLRQFRAKKRNNDGFVTGEDEVIYTFVTNQLFKFGCHFLCVLVMKIFDMPLKAHLRPAADVGPIGLYVLNIIPKKPLPPIENIDVRRIGIGLGNRKSAVLANEFYQRIKMRPIEYKEKVFFERYVKLERLKKSGSGT